MKYKNETRPQSGFTIIELLVVIVVIAILAAITIVSYNGVVGRARTASLQSDLRNASTQLELAKLDTGSYPATGSADVKGSGDNTLEYTSPYGADNGYCMTASHGDAAYYLASTDGQIKQGKCTGHNGGTPVALTCATGYIKVPGNSAFGTSDFCVMKYEAKNDAGANILAISSPNDTPWVNISQTDATSRAAFACQTCHLISEAEWMTIAANVLSVPSNWSGGSVGSGYIYSGHNDGSPAGALAASANDASGYVGTGNSSGSQRRTLTLTNGEVIWDFAGNVWERTSGSLSAAQPGLSGETVYSWKEWTNASVAWNGLPAASRPSAISSQAAGWNSSNGVGMLLSQGGLASFDSFLRGGYWANYTGGTGAGVLALAIESGVRTEPYIGFRVAHD